MRRVRLLVSRWGRLALATLFVLSLTAFLFSFEFGCEWSLPSGNCDIWMVAGGIEVDYDECYFTESCRPPPDSEKGLIGFGTVRVWRHDASWSDRIDWWYEYGLEPFVDCWIPAGGYHLPLYLIPLWIPLVFSGGPLVALRFVDRRRRRRALEGCCASCGYDLRGAAGKVCSECGAQVANAKR